MGIVRVDVYYPGVYSTHHPHSLHTTHIYPSSLSKYFLITGATGLLGSYLMRDCLRRGISVAVLARKSRMESARGRIETILARFESQDGRLMPRPVVLEGDISLDGLGLSSAAQQWVRRNCHSLVHSAASLSFEADPKTKEPWRSNFEGTRHVLEFANAVGIRQFHHVSTAYVCGLRTGTIFESEVNVGQKLGNAYEESKLAAELLVREVEGFDRLTVHRPAIIVGDSKTGYTTTYHGFYTPLKVVHLMVGKVPLSEINILLLLQALGLTGEERKNFVPVDWVSAVMTEVLADSSLHGRTYHLTPRSRVSINEMTTVFEQAIKELSVPALARNSTSPMDGAAFEELFRTQMETYQSYWRDDPQFDASNTLAAANQLPCPTVDAHTMWNLAKYAIDNNFGWPLPPPLPAPWDASAQLASQITDTTLAYEVNTGRQRLGLTIAGRGGGEWTVDSNGQRLVQVEEGCTETGLPRVYMTSQTFQRIAATELTATDALRRGALVIQGLTLPQESILQIVEQAAGHISLPAAKSPPLIKSVLTS